MLIAWNARSGIPARQSSGLATTAAGPPRYLRSTHESIQLIDAAGLIPAGELVANIAGARDPLGGRQ